MSLRANGFGAVPQHSDVEGVEVRHGDIGPPVFIEVASHDSARSHIGGEFNRGVEKGGSAAGEHRHLAP